LGQVLKRTFDLTGFESNDSSYSFLNSIDSFVDGEFLITPGFEFKVHKFSNNYFVGLFPGKSLKHLRSCLDVFKNLKKKRKLDYE